MKKNNLDQIREELKEGELDEALDKLLEVYNDSIYANDLFLFYSQHQTNTRKGSLGIINPGIHDAARNKIIYELLQLLSRIEKGQSEENNLRQAQKGIKKILCAESNPLEKNLFSNVEIRELENIISSHQSEIKLKLSLGLSLNRLIRLLQEEKPNIIHITAFANDNGIYFHSKSDRPMFVENEILLSHLELIEIDVECFLFNTFIAKDLAQKLSAKGVMVIGYSGIINSYDAIDFANGFYNTLGYQKNYVKAYKIGCNSILGGNRADVVSKIFAYLDGELVI